MQAPPPHITLESLERKHLESMLGSDKAVGLRPDIYAHIKEILKNVLSRPVDISEYYQIACQLAGFLSNLNQIGKVTIFDYFFTQIDPARQGDARYFRAMCYDLADQLNALDKWRLKKRQIRVLK